MNEKIPSSALTPDNAFTAECFKLIAEVLPRDKYVKVKGLGTFKLIMVEPRESVDVNTGERILIRGHQKVTFTPDTSMRDIINEPFSCFETTPIYGSTSADATPLAPEAAWENGLMPDTLLDDDQATPDTIADITEATRPGDTAVPHPTSQPPVSDPSATAASFHRFFGWSFWGVLMLVIMACGICYMFNVIWPDTTGTRYTQLDESLESESDTIATTPDAITLLHRATPIAPPQPLTRDQLASLCPDDPRVTEADTTRLRIVGTIDTHTLIYGETLAALSLRYYGRRCYWPYIVAHNNLPQAHHTFVGTAIRLPQLALRDNQPQ